MIDHQIERPQKTNAAHLPNERVALGKRRKLARHKAAILLRLGQQPLFTDGSYGGEGRRAADGALLVGVVTERDGRRLIETIASDERGKGHHTAPQPLAQADDVGFDAKLLEAEPVAGATQGIGDLVDDQQHLVAIADLPHPLPVGLRGHLHVGVADGLGDKGTDPPLLLDDVLQIIGVVQVVPLPAIPDAAIAGGGWNALHPGHQGAHAGAKAGLAAHRDGIEGGTVKGIPQGHHLAVAGDKAGELERNAHHLAAAGGEQHPVEIAGGQFGQGAGTVDSDLMGVAAGRERQIGELLLHRGHHLGVTVAQLMDAVAVKIEVTRARYAGQPASLRALKQIQTGGGEGLMEKVAAILRQSSLYIFALTRPPACPPLAEVDIPFAVGAATAVQLIVTQIATLSRHAGHSASPCQ
ncbi:hypothetical protein D3C76_361480 [compost metagenome]